jgi:tetratricopeptide (TPR) repeat protein
MKPLPRPITRHRRFAVVLVALLGGLGVGTAEGAPSASARARQLNRKARQEFNLGRFREAAALYQEAYSAKPVAEFLYNMAQCHKRLPALADHQRALFYLEGYLRSIEGRPRAAKVEQEITDLKAQIEKEKAEARSARPDPPRQARGKKPVSPPIPRPVASARPTPNAGARLDTSRSSGATAAAPAPTRERSTPIYKRWWFWTAVGVVVAGAATATVIATRPAEVSPIQGTLQPNEATVNP